MSLLENKQVIHIAVECAVIVVITLYFSIKYKKLHKRVESLSNRLKEQDDIIQNLQKKKTLVGVTASIVCSYKSRQWF